MFESVIFGGLSFYLTWYMEVVSATLGLNSWLPFVCQILGLIWPGIAEKCFINNESHGRLTRLTLRFNAKWIYWQWALIWYPKRLTDDVKHKINRSCVWSLNKAKIVDRARMAFPGPDMVHSRAEKNFYRPMKKKASGLRESEMKWKRNLEKKKSENKWKSLWKRNTRGPF